MRRKAALKLKLLPNAITIFRILLIVPIVMALLSEEFGSALVLFIVAGASDGLDGFLARRFNWGSRLGALLDPLADKILLVFTYLALTFIGAFPIWFTGIVVARDVVILGGAAAFRFFIGPFRGRPTLISKVCTFVQIGLGLAMVFQLAVTPLPEWLISFGIYLVVALCIVSGLQYVWIGVGKARRGESEVSDF